MKKVRKERWHGVVRQTLKVLGQFDGGNPSKSMVAFFSVVPVCHGHGGGRVVRS